MENASKALIMAGGVLIGMLVLSLAVYLFATFGAQSHEIHQRISDNQLVQYNTQYTKYSGRQDITIHQIITLCHLAKENNEKYKAIEGPSSSLYINTYKVTVKCNIPTFGNNWDQDRIINNENEILNKLGAGNEAVNSNGDVKHKFECTGIEYHTKGGRIKQITFKYL